MNHSSNAELKTLRTSPNSTLLSLLKEHSWWLAASAAVAGVLLTPSPWGTLGWGGWSAAIRTEIGGGLLGAALIGSVFALIEAKQADERGELEARERKDREASEEAARLRSEQRVEKSAAEALRLVNEFSRPALTNMLPLLARAAGTVISNWQEQEVPPAQVSSFDGLNFLAIELYNSAGPLAAPAANRVHDAYALFMYLVRMEWQRAPTAGMTTAVDKDTRLAVKTARRETARVIESLLGSLEASEARRHSQRYRSLERLWHQRNRLDAWPAYCGLSVLTWVYPSLNWGLDEVLGRLEPDRDRDWWDQLGAEGRSGYLVSLESQLTTAFMETSVGFGVYSDELLRRQFPG